uniref:Endonuclease 8-like 3 n=1 Tax=Apteryx owenii TaxID=8824 RepID=A0A8B9S4X6_APTOW
MVEGPCCALYAERLRARVRQGQVVRSAQGRASLAGAGGMVRGPVCRGAAPQPWQCCCLCSDCIKISSHKFLTGHVYRGVETLGKELFMYFGQTALRVHFGMNGSMCINHDGSKDRNGALPVLEIQLTEDTVCFFEATVEYRIAAESEQKVRMMESLDVCSPKFSCLRAESEIKQQKTHMLCDVLLDQAVLPGVGNIIKNEALFDSGLHPAVKVCQLRDEHIRHLVKMTRDFALLFYKCRKTGSPIYKYYKVYRHPACGQCNEKITICHLGENNRMTYFCYRCQKADPQLVNVSKLPTRNSLIGWAYGRGSCSIEHVAQKSEEEWTCMRCTLINKPSAKNCDACLTSRPEGIENSATFNRSLMKYPCNDFGKPSVEIKINRKAAFGHTTLVLTDLGSKVVLRNDTQIPDGHTQCGSPKRERVLCLDVVLVIPLTLCRSNFLTCHYSKPQVNMTDGICTLNTGHPHCSKHSHLCSLRVVRKDGENKGRQFYICPLPRESRCDYFQWADLNFPFCNHGKRCVMKTVLKIGPNNGKNIFVCPFVKEKQCGFFQWGDNGLGMQIIPSC